MSGDLYKFDVAFSFLKEDEGLAVELNDLIQERLSTFLYSRRQSELAGTDGEKSFNDVFGKEARIVVVLYRSGWGQTSWTRIEETAIRNRAFEEGYDFVIFVPIDDGAVPPWLPKTQIWVGLDRWGATGAAAVIEARVQEAGGAPRAESIEDKATRLKRAIEKEKERKHLLNSEQGVKAAEKEAERLWEIFASKVSAISENTGFTIRTERVQGGVDVCASFGCLAVDWIRRFANTLDESELKISLWPGRPPRPGRSYFEEPRRTRTTSYEFDQSLTGEFGWRERREDRIRSSEDLADYWLGVLMEYTCDQHKKPR